MAPENRYLCDYETAYRRSGGYRISGAGFIRVSENEAPEAARVARTIAIRAGNMVAHGWREAAWKPVTPGSPVFHPDQRKSGMFIVSSGWLDHIYRLRNRRHMRDVYVSEPYEFEVDGLFINDVAVLRAQGWSVSVQPERTLHYPEATVAIWIERPRPTKQATPSRGDL